MTTKIAVRKPARRSPARRPVRPAAKALSAVARLPKIEATQLRANLSRVVSRVGHGHERIAVSRNGTVDVVMVPLEDFERFVWLEDHLDGTEAMKALEEFKRSGEKPVPSADVLKSLGIK